MNIAYIALGSNLSSPERQIDQALHALQSIGELRALSNWYQSKAVGPGNQPDYINGVVKLKTALDPFNLLQQLQGIELKQGRERIIHWGPRTLDLDIVLFNEASLYSHRLTIPHPRLTERDFVIIPLMDIDKNMRLPDGSRLSHYASPQDEGNLKLLKTFSHNKHRDFA